MTIRILQGHAVDVLAGLPAQSVQCVVTSPPYWKMRRYDTPPQTWGDGWVGEWGQEPLPEPYVAHTVEVFRAVHRVLRDDGTLWLNIGDTAWNDSGGQNGGASVREGGPRKISARLVEANRRQGRQRRPPHPVLKRKDIVGVPWRVAFALQADGWYLRAEIIWHKPNAQPDSATDRPGRAHEQVFLLSKRPTYYYDAAAIREPAEWARWGKQTNLKRYGDEHHAGAVREETKAQIAARLDTTSRNKRSVWTIPVASWSEAHFATFPSALIAPCIKAGAPAGGVVLDPCGGAGTVGLVADRLGRDALLIDVSTEYVAMAERRITRDAPLLTFGAVSVEVASE